MNRRPFQYTCVNPKSTEELDFIIENELEIVYDTFRDNVSINHLKEVTSEFSVPLYKDPYVSFHKSKLPDGKPVYFFRHSAIEYVFY